MTYVNGVITSSKTKDERKLPLFDIYRKSAKEDEHQFWGGVLAGKYSAIETLKEKDNMSLDGLYAANFASVIELNFDMSCFFRFDNYARRVQAIINSGAEIDGKLLGATLAIKSLSTSRFKKVTITVTYSNCLYYVVKVIDILNMDWIRTFANVRELAKELDSIDAFRKKGFRVDE